MNPRKTELARRLAEVRQRIAEAAGRSGRPVNAVTLVAVTKTVEADVASELVALGVADLGENRPQELWRKGATLPGARWHMIGHLQRNKVEKTLQLSHLIHSVDSQRLLLAVDAEAVAQNLTADVLLEVNCSGEEAKQGITPADLPRLSAALAELRQTRVLGLMTMATLTDDPNLARPTFARLRLALDDLRGRLAGSVHPLDQLSMGMSGDYEVAIGEGATLIRLGTVLVGGLPTP